MLGGGYKDMFESKSVTAVSQLQWLPLDGITVKGIFWLKGSN
jgi:hypothetical protein